jgi:hypothetical protein
MTFANLPEVTAQEHLTQRYARGVARSSWEAGIPLECADALGQVVRAERGEPDTRWGHSWDLPVPRKVEIAAGLSLIPGLRADLERAELLLINGARARGATWEQLAEVLGLDSRQAAEQRAIRLRGRYPDEPTPQERTGAAAEDGDIDIPFVRFRLPIPTA